MGFNDHKEHDYTQPEWGHSFNIIKSENGGHRLKVVGWGLGIKKKDYLILPNEGGTTRYRVTEINYYFDPRDMWNATLEFAPRQVH
jgi:MioC protein